LGSWGLLGWLGRVRGERKERRRGEGKEEKEGRMVRTLGFLGSA
jgi:hypothetical protein